MKMKKIKCFSVFAPFLQSRTKQEFVYSSGTAKDKGAGTMMLLGASAGIKHPCIHSGHSSPFQTPLKGVTASVLVFQTGNPPSRWRRDGNNCPDFRKSITYPFLFPLTALLVLPVPFHGLPLLHEGCTGSKAPRCQRSGAVT